MEPALKLGFLLLLVGAGVQGWRMFRTGTITLFDTDGPVLLIRRQASPIAYGSFIVFFYAVLTGMAVVVVLNQI